MVSQKPIVDQPGRRAVSMAKGWRVPERGVLKQSTIARRWSSRKNRVSENRPGFQLRRLDWLSWAEAEFRLLPPVTCSDQGRFLKLFRSGTLLELRQL